MVRLHAIPLFHPARTVLALLCSAGVVVPAWAQFDVGAIRSLPNTEFAITTGDFTNDGKLDVAVAGNELMILLGNGDGSFQKPIEYFTPGDSIAAADFNGDGILDLVIPNLAESSVSVLLGNGDGTFQPPIFSDTSAWNQFLAVGDFNNDGKPDVVVVDSPYVSVLLGNGDGTFQAPIDNSSFVGAHLLTVGDFNNDHRLDVLVDGYSFESSGFGLLLGNGDGTLQPSLPTSLNNAPNTPATVGDFNHDGKLDFAIAQNGIAIFLGNGDGTFQPEVDYGISVAIGGVTAADFNGDGKLDLIAPSGPPAAIAELLGNGDGTFRPVRFYQSGLGGGPVVGDFNSDGHSDLALLNGDFAVTTMLNTGVVRFFPAKPLKFPVQLVGTESTAQTVTVINTGANPLSIGSITVMGNFVSSNTCGSTVAAGASCTLDVQFKPKAPGELRGTVTLNDGASSMPQFVLLTGTATGVQMSPSILDFGNQQVGTKSPPQLVTITNVSQITVDFNAFNIVGNDLKDFSLDGQTCGLQIAPGASCTGTVTFRPKQTGSRTARINVDLLASPDPPTRILLTGTGT